MRDPLKRGKDAAKVWKRAFDKSRELYRITKGECFDMIEDIRTNPLAPCILQIKVDGVWKDIFDASCCGGGSGCETGALRYNNGVIEHYNPSTGQWEPSGPQTPIQEQTPPITTEETSDAQCLAATNFAAKIQESKGTLCDAVSDGLGFGGIILAGFGFLADWFGLGFIWEVAAGTIVTLTEGLQAAYTDVAAYDLETDIRCLILPFYETDGSMTAAGVAGALAAIQARSDAEPDFDDPQGIAWRYSYSWVNAAGPQGMTAAGTSMGITDPQCDDCPWEYTFDFKASDGGFSRADLDGNGHLYGVWVPSVGWQSTTAPNASNGHLSTFMGTRKAIGPAHITYVKLITTNDIGDEGDGFGTQNVQLRAGLDVGSGVICTVSFTTSNNNLESEFDALSVDTTGLYISVYIDADTFAVPGAFASVSKLVLKGTGPNPFAAPIA